MTTEEISVYMCTDEMRSFYAMHARLLCALSRPQQTWPVTYTGLTR